MSGKTFVEEGTKIIISWRKRLKIWAIDQQKCYTKSFIYQYKNDSNRFS